MNRFDTISFGLSLIVWAAIMVLVICKAASLAKVLP